MLVQGPSGYVPFAVFHFLAISKIVLLLSRLAKGESKLIPAATSLFFKPFMFAPTFLPVLSAAL